MHLVYLSSLSIYLSIYLSTYTIYLYYLSIQTIQTLSMQTNPNSLRPNERKGLRRHLQQRADVRKPGEEDAGLGEQEGPVLRPHARRRRKERYVFLVLCTYVPALY